MSKKLDEALKEMSNSEDNVSIPMAFAKELLKQLVYNPQQTSSKTSYSFTSYKKEDIVKWLQNPSKNEKSLRDASISLYLSSMHYQRLINYYASLLLWQYVISPLNYDSNKENKKDAYKKQFLKIVNSFELMNIPEMMRNIVVVALREGAYYGVRWSDKNASFIQKINPDYCSITSISDGIFLYSVDMSQIKEEKLGMYPPEFTTMFNAYKNSGIKYQEVPSNISICIKADASIIDYTVPPFAATMPYLFNIANTEALQETSEELNNYKMVTGEVPVDKEGMPTIPWDIVMKYYSNISNAIGDKVGLALAPFKLTSFDFQDSGSIAEIDNVNRAISNYWTTAGTSGLLHGVANSTSGVTKLAIKNDESYVYGILKQAERLFNHYIKTNFSGSIKFKLTFLPTTIYNREEFVKMYKESVPFGIGKSYYMASLGIPQHDIEGLSFLEDEILHYSNLLKPLVNSHNASVTSQDSENPAGRPEADNISDEGESTRDNDSNENR